MRDIVLVTVESWRYDYRQNLGLPSSFEQYEGITTGHYTRPSLSGLLTGRYRDAAMAKPDGSTLASRLAGAGYSTIGVNYSPQTAVGMGFATGFDHYEGIEADDRPLARGSDWRERLARIGPLRYLHRRLFPKGSTLGNLPPDGEAIDTALSQFGDAEPPRFLWLHLLDTHRPYGRGEIALPDAIDARAADTSTKLAADDHAQIQDAYEASLSRASAHVGRLLDGLPDDAAVVITGDHGEELGEEGYYYHGGYRQRLVDSLIRVPVYTRHVPLCGDRVSHIDLAPTLAALAGANVDGLGGVDRQWHPNPGGLTLAPWAGRLNARWTGPCSHVVIEDGAAASVLSTPAVPDGVNEQLRALGYVSAGD